MASHYEDGADDFKVADAPVNGNGAVAQPHSQTEAFGIETGFGTGSSLDKLIIGSREFSEWTAQGNRTPEVRIAETLLANQTAALTSRAFPVRARMLKSVKQQDALRTIFKVPSPQFTTKELWTVFGVMAFFLVMLFLVYTVGAD